MLYMFSTSIRHATKTNSRKKSEKFSFIMFLTNISIYPAVNLTTETHAALCSQLCLLAGCVKTYSCSCGAKKSSHQTIGSSIFGSLIVLNHRISATIMPLVEVF